MILPVISRKRRFAVHIQIATSIPDIIRNVSGVYEGNLGYYFRITMNHATNLKHPYHNFRHVFHVMWLCYAACLFYRKELSPREMRNLLIAAIFHDFNHPGRTGNDDFNIEVAVLALRTYAAEEDRPHLSDIEALIRPTEFPYKVDISSLSLSGQILRDADASQALSVAWVQQIVFGLSSEMSVGPVKVLEMQEGFLRGVKFGTEWARETFPPEMIEEKIAEAKAYLSIIHGE